MTHPRFEKLSNSLAANNLDAVVLNPGPTLTYMTGLHFHLMERPVVVLYAPGRDPVIVLPELEFAKVSNLSYKVQAFTYPENPLGGNNYTVTGTTQPTSTQTTESKSKFTISDFYKSHILPVLVPFHFC